MGQVLGSFLLIHVLGAFLLIAFAQTTPALVLALCTRVQRLSVWLALVQSVEHTCTCKRHAHMLSQ
jgi:hypothetical protein